MGYLKLGTNSYAAGTTSRSMQSADFLIIIIIRSPTSDQVAAMKSIAGVKALAAFVRKAVGALRGKAGVLRARLLFLASLRRRTAVVAGISRHIVCALTTTLRRQQQQKRGHDQEKKPPVHQCRRRCTASSLAPPDGDDDDEEGAVGRSLGFPELMARLLQQVDDGEDDGHADDADDRWALTLHSLFDDKRDHRRRDGDDDDGEGLLVADAVGDGFGDDEEEDEPSVIDVIRRRREGDGREFRIEDEIDHAADMYISRVRRRMSAQAATQQPGL
ncbi:hypothetical protein U9M48_038051 [Paspalum notatum var. saurae]|uniref:Uncharacterized protein n=1 Tax=Paspalum notatum var. saurae TaxID=547442 RepID=A0AAQ3UMI7_PASNO